MEDDKKKEYVLPENSPVSENPDTSYIPRKVESENSSAAEEHQDTQNQSLCSQETVNRSYQYGQQNSVSQPDSQPDEDQRIEQSKPACYRGKEQQTTGYGQSSERQTAGYEQNREQQTVGYEPNQNPGYYRNNQNYGPNGFRHYPPYGGRPPQKSNSFAVVSMIFGIFSLLLACCTGVGGIIMGSLGIIFAILSRGEEPMHTQAKFGLGISIGGMVLGTIVLILTLTLLTSGSFQKQLNDELNRYGYSYGQNYDGYFDDYFNEYSDDYFDDGYYDDFLNGL